MVQSTHHEAQTSRQRRGDLPAAPVRTYVPETRQIQLS